MMKDVTSMAKFVPISQSFVGIYLVGFSGSHKWQVVGWWQLKM
jgi:hypothetical protein